MGTFMYIVVNTTTACENDIDISHLFTQPSIVKSQNSH